MDTKPDLEGLDGWWCTYKAIRAEFKCSTFAEAGKLAAAVAALADERNHHPEVSLHYPGVLRVNLVSHDAGAVTSRDADMARAITSLASESGVEPSSDGLSRVEIAIDVDGEDKLASFWEALLGYKPKGSELVDPTGFGPTFWFQRIAEDPAANDHDFGRVHVDVYYPSSVIEDKIAEVLSSGGQLLSDEHAPDWWVLADSDGNRACICAEDRTGG